MRGARSSHGLTTVSPAFVLVLFAVVAFVGSPGPARADEPIATHPPGTRTGVEQIDRFLDLLETGDAEGLLAIVKYITLPCVDGSEYQGPACAEGEEPGTPVRAFYAGGWMRAENVPGFLDDYIASERALFGVKSGPKSLHRLAARYSVFFAVHPIATIAWLDDEGRLAGTAGIKHSTACEAWREPAWGRHPVLLKPVEPCTGPPAPPLHRHWLRILGGGGDEVARAIAATDDGFVYVASSVADGDDGHAVVLQLRSAEGRVAWRRAVRNLVSSRAALTVGADRSAYLVVERAGKLGKPDLFVIKFGGQGQVVWRRRFGGGATEQVAGAAADERGAVYVLANTASQDVGRQQGHGRADILLARYSLDGKRQWVRLLGGIRRDTATDLSVSPGGSVYVLGRLKSHLLEDTEVPVHSGVVVARYGPFGGRRWFAFPDPKLLHGELVRANAIVAWEGGAYVAGIAPKGSGPRSGLGRIVHFEPDGENHYYNNTEGVYTDIVRGEGPGEFVAVGYTRRGRLSNERNAGGADLVLALLGEDGTSTWLTLLGGPEDDIGRGVVFGDRSVTLVATTSSAEVGGHANRGGRGVLLARYVPPRAEPDAGDGR
jgi:hypothetical protein